MSVRIGYFANIHLVFPCLVIPISALPRARNYSCPMLSIVIVSNSYAIATHTDNSPAGIHTFEMDTNVLQPSLQARI